MRTYTIEELVALAPGVSRRALEKQFGGLGEMTARELLSRFEQASFIERMRLGAYLLGDRRTMSVAAMSSEAHRRVLRVVREAELVAQQEEIERLIELIGEDEG